MWSDIMSIIYQYSKPALRSRSDYDDDNDTHLKLLHKSPDSAAAIL